MARIICFLFVIFICLNMPEAIANNNGAASSAGSYCGIYCLYSIMKFYNIKVEPLQLLKPEYIGSTKGSSLAELKKAAEDNKLYAVPVSNLTSRELRLSPYPVILHVKASLDKKEYDHYELFLKTKDSQALMYDPPALLQRVPFYELSPRWDGTGLIVSNNPINLNVIFAPARNRFLIYAAIVITAVLAMHGIKRWLLPVKSISIAKLIGLSAAEGIGLVSAAILCGMIYHFADDEGFLAHANATASIEQAHRADFIPKITAEKVDKLLGNSANAVFIDARFAADYKQGHLKDAINLPVDSNDQQRSRIMANISKNAQIVVYCQSRGCKFAENVAGKIVSDGFSNVVIFKDGWQGLATKNKN